jgi:hypothetical protein
MTRSLPAGVHTFRAAGFTFRLPPADTAKLLSDSESAESVRAFLLASPDHTVYHLEPYLRHLRENDGVPSDVVLIQRHGAPAFAIPLLQDLPTGVTTAYSGVAFPATAKESTLRRAVNALGDLIAMNRHVVFDVIQSVQSRAYEDSKRMAVLARFIEEIPATKQETYSRVLPLYPSDGSDRPEDGPGRYAHSRRVESESLENELLSRYEAETGFMRYRRFSSALRGRRSSAFRLPRSDAV